MNIADKKVEQHTGEILAAMPKTELHVHADGCLRIATIVDLARQQGITLPLGDNDLFHACVITEAHPSLVAYLERYTLPLLVVQRPEAVERMIYELCEDARRENVRYIEPRFGPALHTRGGMTINDVIAAACRGWAGGARDFGVDGGLILCAMRHRPPEQNVEVARAGERYLGQGVVGFDIAGDEAGYPILAHREAFLCATAAGYGITAHAGEASGAQSVRDAVEIIGASRIGHGVRSYEDPALLQVLKERGITLDMCPKSNVQTSSVSDVATHPIRAYYDGGIRITVSTDARTVSNTTVTREMETLHEALGFSVPELWQTTLWALEAGFAPFDVRNRVLTQFRQEMTALTGRMD